MVSQAPAARKPSLRTLLVATILVSAIPAFAVNQNISSCVSGVGGNSTVCAANCVLTADITCDPDLPGQYITLLANARLDMQGKKITCVAGKSCDTAVVVMGNNATLTSTVPNAKIDGAWDLGVDCQNYASSTVQQIRVETAGRYGIARCAKVQNNLVRAVNPPTFEGYGIYTTGIANTDRITNNYVENWPLIGIWANASHVALTIDHNLVVVRDFSAIYPGNANRGIQLTTTTGSIGILNNVIVGDDVGSNPVPGQYIKTDSNASAVYSRNYCDPTRSTCQTCMSSGACQTPDAPFYLQ